MLKKFTLILLLSLSLQAKAISAGSFLVLDSKGNVIVEQQADLARPIGSITKLIVLASLEQETNTIRITKEDLKLGRMKSTPLRVGKDYTHAQLVELALVPSDNVAAIALGRSIQNFPAPTNTNIVEPSGLSSSNTSTARDIAFLAMSLSGTHLAEVSIRPFSEIGKRHSTNPLLNKPGWEFLLSKTGFINSSGGCLVVLTRIREEVYTFVILGSKNTKERWKDLIELRKLVDSTYTK